jgi:xanthine dehydrogenase YagT iron-sulfur-binding subunit
MPGDTTSSQRTAISLRVNGVERALEVESRRTLLDALREDLGLTGAKPGCEMGNCGACTVLLDGEAIYSCLALAVECQGRAVTTIEGLTQGDALDPIQQAFIAHDALQCGFCTPGQIVSAAALVEGEPSPTDEQIRHAMAGNLCRCGTYPKIEEAIRTWRD